MRRWTLLLAGPWSWLELGFRLEDGCESARICSHLTGRLVCLQRKLQHNAIANQIICLTGVDNTEKLPVDTEFGIQ